jgi:hypothetical protein
MDPEAQSKKEEEEAEKQAQRTKEEEEKAPEAGGRCKLKGMKFQKLKDAGTLPDYVIDLFNNAGSETGQKRKEQTEIINNLLRKDDEGSYILNLQSPMFKEAHKSFFERKSKDKKKGVILEVAEDRCGGEHKLARALEAKRVIVEKRNGVEFYIFRSMEATETYGYGKEQEASGKMALDGAAYGDISDGMSRSSCFARLAPPALENVSDAPREACMSEDASANVLNVLTQISVEIVTLCKDQAPRKSDYTLVPPKTSFFKTPSQINFIAKRIFNSSRHIFSSSFCKIRQDCLRSSHVPADSKRNYMLRIRTLLEISHFQILQDAARFGKIRQDSA